MRRSRPIAGRKPHEVMGLWCEELDKCVILILRFVFVSVGLFHALKLLLMSVSS